MLIFAVLIAACPGALTYRSGLSIDADGAPNAYHPEDKGLDHLANAGKPGKWWGIVTKDGAPVIQRPGDPFPGYYVSTTSLMDKTKPETSPARYVDSTKIPYLAIPPSLIKQGAKLGDFAAVVNTANGKIAYAIVADVGPKDHLGEGSIALADALGIASNPKKGGAKEGIAYAIFPSSGTGKPRTLEELNAEGARLLLQFGGSRKLTECAP